MQEKIYRHPRALNDDGTVSPPDLPGSDWILNYEALEPYRVD